MRTGRPPRRTSMGLNTRLLMRASQRGIGIALPHCLETRLLPRRDRLPLGLLRCSGAKHDNAQPDEPDDLEKAEEVPGLQQSRNDRCNPRKGGLHLGTPDRHMPGPGTRWWAWAA